MHLVVCDDKATLEWVLQNCQPAIWAGLLHVYTTNGQMQYWHASVGKNTAHMCATEDILVNLDGENLIGQDFPIDIERRFQQGKKFLQYQYREGTCGRIVWYRKDFRALRG